MKDIPLHDIKPLVEVPDNSFIYLLIVGVVLAIVLVLFLAWLYKAYKKSKLVSLRKGYLEKLHAIDTNNAKEAAYKISSYARLVVQSEEDIQRLEALENFLEQYKYKKEVGAMDSDTLAAYKHFLEALDAA